MRVLLSPWLSYAALLALALKVLWRIWDYRDLTTGDTVIYYVIARTVFEDGRLNVVSSPLYTLFMAGLMAVSTDAYFVITAHRVLIVLATDLLVLALMRRLLPSGVAWLVAVWWTVLPVNFETMYEAHLFTVVPTLAACLVAAARPPRAARALVLGALVASTLLVRHELIIATAVWAGICAVHELRSRPGTPADRRRLTATYATPVFLALVAGGLCLTRSTVTRDELPQRLRAKHALNVCQIYAFGYQQRRPDWSKSPWLDCRELLGDIRPALDFSQYLSVSQSGVSLQEWATVHRITAIYIDESLSPIPHVQAFVSNHDAATWRTIARVDGPADRWRLVEYTGPPR